MTSRSGTHLGAVIDIVSLRKAFPSAGGHERFITVLQSLSFVVRAGEWLTVVGPSGCGKSTLIGTIAGFVDPDEGAVLIDGAPVAGPGPDRVVVSQDLALFDWKTVLENVEFGLKARNLPKGQRAKLAREYLRRVRLEGVERQYPYVLSGGMRQRLAMARALAVEPKCLLLDEPLGALDAQLRIQLQDELQELWARGGRTVLSVSHDIEEAIYLSDRVVILTPAPARIDDVVAIDLPRPRISSMRSQSRFVELKQWIWGRLSQHLGL